MRVDPPTPSQLETRRRVRAVRLAIVASIVVCIVELIIGVLLELESMIAEGIHTLADGVDSIIVLIAVLLAARPADRSHQFGHGKFEALGATVEGMFVLFAAGGIAYRGIGRLLHGQTPDAIPLYVCLVMAAAAVFYLFVSMHLMREAKATRSPALLAEALHLRTHIYIAGGVAGGLLIGALGDWPLADTLLTLAIAVCLVAIAVHIFKEVLVQFTDAALPPEEMETIGGITDRFSNRFIEVHGLRTRQSGAERQIEMHLVVMPQTTVAEAHSLGHEIEAAIAGHWPTSRTTVHLEPLNIDDTDHAAWMQNQPKVRTDEDSPDEREFIH